MYKTTFLSDPPLKTHHTRMQSPRLHHVCFRPFRLKSPDYRPDIRQRPHHEPSEEVERLGRSTPRDLLESSIETAQMSPHPPTRPIALFSQISGFTSASAPNHPRSFVDTSCNGVSPTLYRHTVLTILLANLRQDVLVEPRPSQDRLRHPLLLLFSIALQHSPIAQEMFDPVLTDENAAPLSDLSLLRSSPPALHARVHEVPQTPA